MIRATRGDASWPTRASPDGRVIQDQHGAPWLGVGDTAWSLIGQLSDAEIVHYLDNRAAKGVNLVLVSAPEAWYADKAPANIDGEPPFTGAPFRSELNDPYWRRLDHALDLGEARGISFLVCPMYTGWGRDGWAAELNIATSDDTRRYGHRLAERYGSRDNVLWLMGHDMPDLSPALKARGKALADALRAGTSQLITAASNRSRDQGSLGIGSEEWAGSGVSLDFDTQYDYSGTPGRNAATLWALDPPRPFVFLEGVYEQEIPGPLPRGDVLLRRQLWGPFVNGATGVFFGNNPVWGLGASRLYTACQGTWKQNLDGPGSQDLARFAELTARMGPAWGATVQDADGTFVTSAGSGAATVSARYGTALALIYHPDFGSAPLNIALSKLSPTRASVNVRAYDPATGAETMLGTYATSRGLTLGPPGANSRGDRDWLFVIE